MALFKTNRFKNVKAMIGVWPITVWEYEPGGQQERSIKKLIGDTEDDTTRTNCFQPDDPVGKRRYEMTVSIFSPTVAAVALNLYAPKNGGVCFDPFAGGGTRMCMACAHDMDYVGIELREEECKALNAKAKRLEIEDHVTIIQGDACDKHPEIESDSADFLLTCPPYYDLEKYNGGEGDLSMLPSYKEFIQKLYPCVEETYRILKRGAVSVWVVGLLRDSKGRLLFMNHDVICIHEECGFFVKEEVIVYPKTGGALTRSNMFLKGNHNLVRVHQYALVFQKK